MTASYPYKSMVTHDDVFYYDEKKRSRGWRIWLSGTTSGRLVLCLIAAIIITFSLSSHDIYSNHFRQGYTSLPPGFDFESRYGPVPEEDWVPMNKTMGFEKIYVLNMATRTDKLAEMTMVSHIMGIPFEIVTGVDGLALRPDIDHFKAGIWGCAEGHAKVWQKMLQDKVESAIIFEDDVDFDERIHEQVARMQAPFETFLTLMSKNHSIPARTPSDPWHSKEWDLLWLGSELEKSWPAEDGKKLPYITYEDPTVVHPKDEQDVVTHALADYGFAEERKVDAASGRVRIIQVVRETFATHGYAVSASGAKKLLYNNAHKGDLIDHVDFVMHDMANRGKLRSYSILPGVFSQFNGPGGRYSDSDREHATAKLAGVDGTSPGVEKSVKINLLSHIEEDIPRR